MRFLNDEQKLWNKANIIRSFVIGSVVSASLIYFILSESILVFFISLGLIAVCAVLFLELNMIDRGHFYLSQNIFSAILGFISSLIVNTSGFLPPYLFIMVIALVLLWFREIIFKKIRKFKMKK